MDLVKAYLAFEKEKDNSIEVWFGGKFMGTVDSVPYNTSSSEEFSAFWSGER